MLVNIMQPVKTRVKQNYKPPETESHNPRPLIGSCISLELPEK